MQVAQSTHAIADFIFEYPELAKQWKETSNYVVCLSVKNLEELEILSKTIEDENITRFYEPDLDNQLTSFCILGTNEVRKKLSHLPLTLKNFKQSKSLNGEAMSKKCVTTLN